MSEISLFDSAGTPVAYIDMNDGQTIYAFSGEPLAYVDSEHVYGFNGVHLGWFSEGIFWDHSGSRVGFIRETVPGFTHSDPFKHSKHFKPSPSFKRTPPFMPSRSYFSNSDMTLYDLLLRGMS